jgi:hypothetical protein
MKVAICFSGLPRFVEQTHRYWSRSILAPYNPDVFVHTWRWSDKWNPNHNIAEQIQSLYNPKVLQIESAKHFDTGIYTDRVWPHRTTPQTVISQWYSIKQSIGHKAKYEEVMGFNYDVVIRARFDWFLKEIQLEQNDMINVALTPTLAGHRFSYDDQIYTGINDQFGFGSSKNMDTYAGLFDNMSSLYANHGVDFCSELFLKGHLVENNIEVNEIPLNNGITRLEGIMP